MPFLCLFWYSGLWSYIDQSMATQGWCFESAFWKDAVQAIVFSVALSLINTLMTVPFSIYKTFVIEEKYGFNKTTPKTFVVDIVKSTVLVIVFTSVLLPLLLWVVEIAGDRLVVYMVGTTMTIIIIF